MANSNDVDIYCDGAVSALAYMAEAGAEQEHVLAVASLMSLPLEGIDASDRERLVMAYGEEFFIEYAKL